MRSEVVGYNAITLSMDPANDFTLTDDDKKDLLGISRLTLDKYVISRNKPSLDPGDYSQSLNNEAGCFVTLRKEGKLRGCIGSFRPDKPLCSMVQSLTIASATEDTRFLPVQKGELDDIEIEISVLTPLRKIQDINEIELGKHGIYISENGRSGTFLPQVATETGWTVEEFLGHCSKDKAGLGWDGWRKAGLYTYEAIVFKEADYINNK
jgi:AmmeMemoRadiSam system protein A